MKNDTIFNEMTMMILKESKRSDCCDNYDDEFCCQDFEDTMKGLDTAQMSYTIDALPILKNEGGEECGEGCCESYMIEYDMLEKLIESYEDIHNEFEAHAAICEHYGMEPESLIVVFERLHLPLPVERIFLPTLGIFSISVIFFAPYRSAAIAAVSPDAPAPITAISVKNFSIAAPFKIVKYNNPFIN